MPTGQDLGDFFAAAGGSPVNRPQLNAFVANSQARNGLLSVQTQEAMIKAAQAQEEQGARENVYSDLIAMGAKPSEAMLGRDIGVGALGNAEVMAKALGLFKLGYGDPASQVAGQQMAQGKVAGPITQPANYFPLAAPPGGSALQAPQQSLEGAAQTQNLQATAGLHNVQAAAGGFSPNRGMTPLAPEQQAKLTKLIGAGIIGPSQMYSFSRNPSLIDSVSDAYDADPTNLAGIAHAKQAQLQSLTSGQLSKSMVSLNTAIAHMGLVPGTTAALNNGDFKFLNKVYQGFNAQTGVSAPALADQLSQFLGREVVNAVQANGGGEREREAAQALYEKSQAPGVLQDVANQGAQLLAGRAGAIEQDYIGTQSMGQPGTEEQYRRQFRMRFLTPDARRVTGMGVVGEQTPPHHVQPGNGPAVTPPGAPPAGAAPPPGLTLVN